MNQQVFNSGWDRKVDAKMHENLRGAKRVFLWYYGERSSRPHVVLTHLSGMSVPLHTTNLLPKHGLPTPLLPPRGGHVPGQRWYDTSVTDQQPTSRQVVRQQWSSHQNASPQEKDAQDTHSAWSDWPVLEKTRASAPAGNGREKIQVRQGWTGKGLIGWLIFLVYIEWSLTGLKRLNYSYELYC